MQEEGNKAYEQHDGTWTDPFTLTGYELRMSVRLFRTTRQLVAGKTLSSWEKYGSVHQYCVDMATREIYQPHEYHRVPPPLPSV